MQIRRTFSLDSRHVGVPFHARLTRLEITDKWQRVDEGVSIADEVPILQKFSLHRFTDTDVWLDWRDLLRDSFSRVLVVLQASIELKGRYYEVYYSFQIFV